MQLSLRTLTKALDVHRVTVYKWMRDTVDARPRTSLERMVDAWTDLLPGIPNPLLALGFAQVASGVVILTGEVHRRLSATGHIQRLVEHFPGVEIYEFPRQESQQKGEVNANVPE